MNRNVTARIVNEAIALCEIDAHIYLNYSGRAMYGATCDGILVKSFGDAFKFFLALGQVATHELEELPLDGDEFDDLEEAVIEMTGVARTDNMGTDFIVYFPGFEIR